jgi:hypothetical protein
LTPKPFQLLAYVKMYLLTLLPYLMSSFKLQQVNHCIKKKRNHQFQIFTKMKCKQRLCQRVKNLAPSGNCNVCEDAICEVRTDAVQLENKKHVENIKVDMELMIDAHEKLSRGISLDPKLVSSLLLGGVINIINQHDALSQLELKVKDIELENLTSKTRIESLENWMIKQNNNIEKLEGKVSSIHEKEVIMNSVKSASPNVKVLKCDVCDQTFTRNCDFENHMDEHQKNREYECNICRKQFFLRWRMEKHIKAHAETAKYCHYHNNRKLCPYEKIGCMFRHESSGPCKSLHCTRRLCQFEHKEVLVETETIDEVNECNDEPVNENMEIETLNETQNNDLLEDDQVGCSMCACTFLDQEELAYHMEFDHI